MESKPQPKYGWRGQTTTGKFAPGDRVQHIDTGNYGYISHRKIASKFPGINQPVWAVNFDHGGKNFSQREDTLRKVDDSET